MTILKSASLVVDSSPLLATGRVVSRTLESVSTLPDLPARLSTEIVESDVNFSDELPACHAGGRGFEPRRSRQGFQALSPDFGFRDFGLQS